MYIKNIFKKSALLLICTWMIQNSYGQQSSIFSHYYWNEQYHNPAYVGSKEMLHVQAIDRLQWVGMEGAPNILNFSAHTPLKKDNIALGIQFYNDRIGAFSTNGITAQYAYRLKFKEKYTLSLGVNGGAEFRNLDVQKLTTEDQIPDIVSPNTFEKSWMPIFGAGAYFYGDNFSVGLGIPQLLPKGIFKNEKWGLQPVQQFFISGAYQWNIQNNFRLLPTTTLRIIQSEPTQAEFTVSGIFYDKFLVGIGVRTEKSAVILGQYMLPIDNDSKKITFGYSYDMSWKLLRTANSGSHEFIVSFDMQAFKPSSVIYKSPRYF